MEQHTILEKLLELAEELAIEVRHTPAAGTDEHPGGSVVRLKGKEILFLDPSAGLADQIAAAAAALQDRQQLNDRFIPPEVRQVIEEQEQA
ncbi:MAG: hypothetical protein HZA50_00110 [Planctomycetes bacterium]|nr:hypothetical protein [Planctomycetota bacterium]